MPDAVVPAAAYASIAAGVAGLALAAAARLAGAWPGDARSAAAAREGDDALRALLVL